MATVAFRNTAGPNGPVSLLDNLAAFGSLVGTTQRIAVWQDGQGGSLYNEVHAIGDGLVFDFRPGVVTPKAGRVHSLAVYDAGATPVALMAAFGLDAPLRLIAGSNGGFWAQVLRGADTIHMGAALKTLWGDTHYAPMYLDRRTPGDRIDVAYTTDPNEREISGDAFFVMGHYDEEDLARPRTTLRGGNDRILGTTARSRIAGDAFSLTREGRVYGGNDLIDLSGVPEVTSVWVFGDVGGVSGDGGSSAERVEGGNDRIVGPGGSSGSLAAVLVGDVGTVEYPADQFASVPTIVGGHDHITLRGPALAVGDVYDAGPAHLTGGNDTLVGSLGDDTLVGDFYHLFDGWGVAGNDTLSGRAGNDLLYGDRADLNAGGDTGGQDLIYAGPGDDTVDGGVGDDTLHGGPGTDTLSFESIERPVDVNLALGTATGQGADRIRGFERVLGSTNDDRIAGNGAANHLDGAYGSDTLLGAQGNDTLVAGGGADLVTGGPGADAFRFISADGSVATITDLRSGTDRIEVISANFGGLPVGSLNQGNFRRVDLPHILVVISEPLFLYDGVAGTLAFDLDGDGPRAAVPIAALTGPKALLASDILVLAS